MEALVQMVVSTPDDTDEKTRFKYVFLDASVTNYRTFSIFVNSLWCEFLEENQRTISFKTIYRFYNLTDCLRVLCC